MVWNIRGAGTIGGLMMLVVVAVVGQMSLNRIAVGRDAEPEALEGFQARLVGAHSIFLDDVMLAGYSPDGAARDLGVFRAFTAERGKERVQFIADIDSDGRSERIGYEVREGSLVRTVESRSGDGWEPWFSAPIADRVVGFRIRFLDANRSELSPEAVVGRDAPQIHSVALTLEMSGGAAANRPVEKLAGEVALRNLSA